MPSKSGGGLSQEQRLWVVLALLGTAVVCFAAGILVNKIQTGQKVAMTEEPGQVERLPGAKDTKERSSGDDSAEGKASTTTSTAGVQVSPAPVTLPGGEADKAPPSRPVTQRDANTQFVPAPPPKRESTVTKEETTNAAVQVAEPAALAPTADAPASPDSAPMPTSDEAPPVTPVSPLDDIASEDTPAEKAPEDGATAGFTIQVGSFDTMANAERFKKAIEDKSDYEVTLFPVKDSKVVKACIGTFETKDAAAKERAVLDRVQDFKGCFVKPLSEL